ncbi:hypothetical protein SBBP2_330011 [Burkholderiales bacterium]|nr:hypothetical protein SBBP2_330011 [Burkholderiales bacterium]
MKRPSRALRESVATMLKNGRFLAPPRASRITTMELSASPNVDKPRILAWRPAPSKTVWGRRRGAGCALGHLGSGERPVTALQKLLPWVRGAETLVKPRLQAAHVVVGDHAEEPSVLIDYRDRPQSVAR